MVKKRKNKTANKFLIAIISPPQVPFLWFVFLWHLHPIEVIFRDDKKRVGPTRRWHSDQVVIFLIVCIYRFLATVMRFSGTF